MIGTTAALGTLAATTAPKLLGTALTGKAAGKVAQVASSATKGLVKPALVYAPSKLERDYKQRTLAEAARLAGARSGLTYGQEQRALAAGAGQVQSAVEQQGAQLQRGGDVQAGQSGVAQQAQRQLTQDAIAGRGQVASTVRDAGIKELARRQAAMKQDQLRLVQMERTRREKALGVHTPEPLSADIAAGQATRKLPADLEKQLLAFYSATPTGA